MKWLDIGGSHALEHKYGDITMSRQTDGITINGQL